jgi:A/G-specific adenine glycosylase
MELGATVCVPGPPKCLLCPVRNLCATQGELAQIRSNGRQKKRSVQYALGKRDGDIFLVQRAHDASLMPGMWELPEIKMLKGDETPVLRVRHSITVTDYEVRVVETMPSPEVNGIWVSQRRLPSMALTGLARKILRRTGLI